MLGRAIDGAHSSIRSKLAGRLSGDRVAETFLICDLDTAQPLASDRTVWFDPPFAGGQFPTPSGKVELYCAALADDGADPLPGRFN